MLKNGRRIMTVCIVKCNYKGIGIYDRKMEVPI